MNNTETLKNEIAEAFKQISSIPVSGEAVDMLAMAREHLRRAYKLCGEEESDNG